MKYLIANWKANKNIAEARHWLQVFTIEVYQQPRILQALNAATIKIIICPPFPFLLLFQELTARFNNIALGAQTISPFPAGSFTGEVTGRSLVGLVEFVLIGHSERRQYNKEEGDRIISQLNACKQYNLQPILCIRDEKDMVSKTIDYIAFEPVSAIGTGKNMPLDEVIKQKKKLSLLPTTKFFYGGSANAQNIPNYLASKEIDGVLIGTVSLEVEEFLATLDNLVTNIN